ncbi:MAG: hypothetical protein ACFN09_07850, partial [Bifidobacterium dentium]
VKPLNNNLKNTSVINVTVVENKLSYPKMKLSILTTKLKLAGHGRAGTARAGNRPTIRNLRGGGVCEYRRSDRELDGFVA